MYVTIQSFVDEYRNESEFTQKLLNALTDDSLKQEVAPGFRTIGHLAWHLVPSGGILTPTGLKFEAPPEHSNAPASASVIAKSYHAASQAIIEAVRTQWKDDQLQESVTIFGEQWKNGYTLSMFLRHEIHHRGQLTVLMRQAGVPVTGIYGPTKEEWIGIGMEAPL
ncbi:DinB family protein [Paenibacillus sp. sptzw28]|uniref:DinB family protein n=1 Tax=Paenibacillus sp. sptzw28 TaxID=715179 RepID=UPI001C6F171D|nr:DinB family protein [Paenibacillus sp. sptzw28]QYR21887.1 DinB family protein [Paenibacillus sp. sptzw28]